MARILAIDDEAMSLKALVGVLGADHEVVAFTDSAAGSQEASLGGFDLALIDLNMPPPDGFGILRMIQQLERPFPVIVISARDEARAAVEALRLGAIDFIVKPASPEAIRALVASTVEPTSVAEEAPSFGFAGRSAAIGLVRKSIPLLARVRESVLIVGATGTGKELFAHALHEHSPRCLGPFIAHNMAATPSELTESIFFGHVRGSFSGASADHVGLFERADNGTLFLDEVDSFPLGLQAKLLRVLESGCIQRVGSSVETRLDVRVVAASSVDLRERAAQSAFRMDLYYRLCQFEVRLPPLNERPEDIPDLVGQFVEEFAKESEVTPRLSPATLHVLCAHRWPGNCRELRHALRAAAFVAGSERILPCHLPANVRTAAHGVDSRGDLQSVEQGHIARVLEQVAGNRSLAARILGIDRGTLARKLKSAADSHEARPG